MAGRVTAPAKVREVGYWVRTRVDTNPVLLSSDKLVARVIGYARTGRYTHAITRLRIAIRTGLSLRTVTRAIGRLVAAGVLLVEQQGRIEAGKRYQQVYRILSPQVSSRDTLSPLGGEVRRKTRRATRGQQLSLEIPLPDRTTARQPCAQPHRWHPQASAAAGYGT
jgi:DNA-binding transcriptional ArsR family regulator